MMFEVDVKKLSKMKLAELLYNVVKNKELESDETDKKYAKGLQQWSDYVGYRVYDRNEALIKEAYSKETRGLTFRTTNPRLGQLFIDNESFPFKQMVVNARHVSMFSRMAPDKSLLFHFDYDGNAKVIEFIQNWIDDDRNGLVLGRGRVHKNCLIVTSHGMRIAIDRICPLEIVVEGIHGEHHGIIQYNVLFSFENALILEAGNLA